MKEIFILTEVADREINSLKFNNLVEAQSAMMDSFQETLELEEGNTNTMLEIWDDLERIGYYEAPDYGLTMYSGYYNRKNGGQLDWDISRFEI